MPAFVDTNVAVYALGRDSDKKARAKQILDDAPIASSQVINEAICVLMGKQRFARDEAYEVADARISRESLYRALSPKGNPTLKTLLAVLKAVGMRLSVEPGQHAAA